MQSNLTDNAFSSFLQGNRFAVVVGTNKSGQSNYVAPLQFAERDAREMARILEEEYSHFTLVDSLLTGERATTSLVRDAVLELSLKRTAEDFLLFYFSGHAKPMRTGPGKGQKDIYFVTHDFREDFAAESPTSYLSVRWLQDVLYRAAAHTVILFLDCCYTISEPSIGQIDVNKIIQEYLGGVPRLPASRIRITLTAGDFNREAYESKGHGKMTELLLRALRGDAQEAMDDDGYVDIHLLCRYLHNNMPEDQLPRLSTDIARKCILAYHPDKATRQQRTSTQQQSSEFEDVMMKFANTMDQVINSADYFNKRAPHMLTFDYQPCRNATLDDLDPARLAKFFEKDRVREQDDYLLDASGEAQLTNFDFLQQSFPTYGALLCFGRMPQRYIATAVTRCIYWNGTTRDKGIVIDDKEWRGSLLQQYERSREFLSKYRRSGRLINEEGRAEQLDVPLVALEEALANALVHREYANRPDFVKVEIFEDRIEIKNPGELIPPMTLELISIEDNSRLRNPQIARIFHLYGYMEKAGSGVLRMQSAMEKAGLPPPEFTLGKDKTFKVVFRRPEQVLEEAAKLRDTVVSVPKSVHNLGLHEWTEADLRHYPSLREQFVSLSRVFDNWLVSKPQKRGQRIRVLWLQGEEGTHRTQALMSCLSGVHTDRPPMYDAGMDLGLLAGALDQLLFSKRYPMPPLISIELSTDEHGTAWKDVRNVLASAQKHFSEDDQPYPRLIVAGTGEQAQEAWQTLQERLEIKIIDTKGRDLERPYSFHGVHGMESETLSREDVFIRGLPITEKKLFGRKEELETLTRAWNSNQCRILSLVAYGGTGKSALVNTWLSQMRDQDYLGAQKVFAWSFYSQGTKENLVSADVFVSHALTWLAPDEPIPLNPWAQGLALARLIKQHRFLLVLDGLEPLQHPLSAPDVGGQLTDNSIRALLEELSDPSDWKGLCVITTRVPLTDLLRFEEPNQEEMGRVVQLELENLDYQAGAALLKYLIKADARQRDLEKAVGEVQGHALAITLLGNYLRDVHNGDLAGRFDLEELTVAEQEGGHARRIMASYERWLQKNQRVAELALLRLIGLFDRPAPPEAMSVLLEGVDLNPFRSELDQVGGEVWNRCVAALREMGLLNKENPEWPGTIDAHPLVREHFRHELQRDGQMWVEGNRRLYEYYRDTAPPLPSDSKSMNLLYAAVTHGCAAGLHQQVFDEVLLSRVWRDRRTNYSTRRLGMAGSDLVALSNYFQHRQWTQLQERSLSEPARILILTNAGVRLRQLGRLVEARQCFGAVVRESAQAQESEDASYAAAQYCELLVIAGKLAGTTGDPDTALASGQRAIAFADHGKEPYFSMHARSSLAEVYFMLGDLEKANALFEEAKTIDQECHPKPPFLYSQSLFRYGYYLIETGRAQRLLVDASKREGWGTNGNDTSLLSRAIRSLILGAAHRAVIESGERTLTFIGEAEKILNDSIIQFRTAGYADYTVRGLLERTHFYRIRRFAEDYGKILEDLDQATFEAQRGQMELLYADILLQRLACYLDFWHMMSDAERTNIRDKVAETLIEATELIDKLHYHRRDVMLATLQTVAAQQGVANEPSGSRNPGPPYP